MIFPREHSILWSGHCYMYFCFFISCNHHKYRKILGSNTSNKRLFLRKSEFKKVGYSVRWEHLFWRESANDWSIKKNFTTGPRHTENQSFTFLKLLPVLTEQCDYFRLPPLLPNKHLTNPRCEHNARLVKS